MNGDSEDIKRNCKMLFGGLDTNLQAEISAQLFLEYCIYQDQSDNTKRLIPLVNTVAEALVNSSEGDDSINTGVKAVQMYLRIPPVEYFGETIERLGFMDSQSIDEMLEIQPKGKILGTFLMEQGLLSEEQRDITVIVQKRLFTVQEVYTRLLNPDTENIEDDVTESLKGVFQHFLTSTAELEDDLRQSNSENIHSAMHRLENIIIETEKNTNSVLEIVDNLFSLEDEIMVALKEIERDTDPLNNVVLDNIKSIIKKVDSLNSLNLELNSSQQIQDRIGQQLLKIIPSIKTFHDQLLKIADKLKLNLKNIEPSDDDLMKVGYGTDKADERVEQDDVDDMLSSLGL